MTYAELLADAIVGTARAEVLRARQNDLASSIAAIMAGSWRGRPRGDICSSGYVVHSLEAALWCVGRTSNFGDAALLAANLADDADTTAAITGQLAGARYGAKAMPSEWTDQLAWQEKIMAIANGLFEDSLR